MKKLIIDLASIVAVILLAACNSNSSSSGKTENTDTAKNSMVTAVKYTCTMHPEVISDTPGKCPKCGMEMVPMKDTMNMSKDSMMK
jgi:hypothetical protein